MLFPSQRLSVGEGVVDGFKDVLDCVEEALNGLYAFLVVLLLRIQLEDGSLQAVESGPEFFRLLEQDPLPYCFRGLVSIAHTSIPSFARTLESLWSSSSGVSAAMLLTRP